MSLEPSDSVCDVCHQRRPATEIITDGAVGSDGKLYVMGRTCHQCFSAVIEADYRESEESISD